MIKLHINDRSNKSYILAQKFCHPRLSALTLELYMSICKNGFWPQVPLLFGVS